MAQKSDPCKIIVVYYSMSRSQPSNRSRNKTRKKPMLTIMDEAAVQHAENNPNYSPEGWNITHRIVPQISYTHTEDTYDGIVFLLGHSEFRGSCSFITTKPVFKASPSVKACALAALVWVRFMPGLSLEPAVFQGLGLHRNPIRSSL